MHWDSLPLVVIAHSIPPHQIPMCAIVDVDYWPGVAAFPVRTV